MFCTNNNTFIKISVSNQPLFSLVYHHTPFSISIYILQYYKLGGLKKYCSAIIMMPTHNNLK